MKVILKQDVAKIGRRLDIVNVPDGYALNKLIPQGMGEPATPAAINRIRQQKDSKAVSDAVEAGQFKATVETLSDATVTVTVDANEQGHLFKAVSVDDIVTAAAKANITIAPAWIKIAVPIKEVGEHAVVLRHDGEHAEITVTITAK